MRKHSVALYAADGASLGFRTLAAAQQLIANGLVDPVYGRKGHLKAVFSKKDDGPPTVIEGGAPRGTCYSFQTRIESGPLVWKLKRLGKKDELRPLFRQVVADCLVNS